MAGSDFFCVAVNELSAAITPPSLCGTPASRRPISTRREFREHEVIEGAEMADAENFSGKFGKPRSKRHVEMLKDHGAQLIGVVALRHENGGERAGKFARLFAHDFQAPGSNGRACCFRVAVMPLENIFQALLPAS